jgi:hypothetical protein
MHRQQPGNNSTVDKLVAHKQIVVMNGSVSNRENMASLSICQTTLKWTIKMTLNKPGSEYGLKVHATVLFQPRDVQKEVHRLFGSAPKGWRK